MKEYPIGYRFRIPTIQQLTDAGWINDYGIYHHPAFPANSILNAMVRQHEGETREVRTPAFKGWYGAEDNWDWPVEACEIATGVSGFKVDGPVASCTLVHTCTPGATPIFGWIICKKCGKNLHQFQAFRQETP